VSYKIKVYPEDFIVSEVVSLTPSESGEYSLYLLKKKNLSTWDALGQIAKKWHLPLKYFGYGGLKDKNAITFQYITIKNGPKGDFIKKELELTYLGKSISPLGKTHLLGNNFEIVVREAEIEANELYKRSEEIKRYGIPNYFDEQRFSSVKECKKFAVKEIIKGNFESALYLILALSSPDEFSYSRKLRDCLKKNWRKWKECLPFANLNWEKNLLQFLASHNPSQRTFKRALHLIDQEYLFFLGNVYQSYLWNEVLKEVLIHLDLTDIAIPFLFEKLYFYKDLSQEKLDLLRNLKIPYPSPKMQVQDTPQIPLYSLYLKIFKREGLEDFKALRSFIKGLIFKSYPRPAIIFPIDLTCEKLADKTYKIKFFLEKGSYATLIIKRLFYAHSPS
jgi:tRNA pseudouridine13 synthase